MKINNKPGFTLIEILVVIAIISVLASISYVFVQDYKNKAYFARFGQEINQLGIAIELFAQDNDNEYPEDVNRDLPNGLEDYLAPGDWPKAPWPGSVYDWDNWDPGSLAQPPFDQIYQISVRFCPIDGPLSACNFPNQEWVDGSWDIKSAVFYCIEGPCRSHSSKPYDHPGFCVNC